MGLIFNPNRDFMKKFSVIKFMRSDQNLFSYRFIKLISHWLLSSFFEEDIYFKQRLFRGFHINLD